MSPHAERCAVGRRRPPVATPEPARTVLRASVIYVAVSGILCLVVVGIPLFFTVALLDTIFCILAGVKARDGLVWRYPLSIRFVWRRLSAGACPLSWHRRGTATKEISP